MSYQKQAESQAKPFRYIRKEVAQKQKEQEALEELLHPEQYPDPNHDQKRKDPNVY